MNKQKADSGIEWTHVFGPGTGYTWNPIAGCPHGCRWTMPDGSEAVCYAEAVAGGLASAAYPGGFASHYWRPDELEAPLHLRQPAGIFLGSMADVFAPRVPVDQIEAVLDIVRRCPEHVFFALTKNAPGLLKFDLPFNLWTGVSMPPSTMFGKPLNDEQQKRFVYRALDVLDRLKGHMRWMSFEPLSFNVAWPLDQWVVGHAVGERIGLPLEWAVIGAASNGTTTYQPDRRHVKRLLFELESDAIPVFFKGNLDWTPRRESFPQWSRDPVQMRLGL